MREAKTKLESMLSIKEIVMYVRSKGVVALHTDNKLVRRKIRALLYMASAEIEERIWNFIEPTDNDDMDVGGDSTTSELIQDIASELILTSYQTTKNNILKGALYDLT